MKKILIALIASMFIISVLPGIFGLEANDSEFKERKYEENRSIIKVYTAHGIERAPGARGKPGAYVIITYPHEGDPLSGPVTITVDSNYNPTISIDGTAVGSGSEYIWYTTQYADGPHTISASARGITDTISVTVNNNGGGNTAPDVSITNPNNGASLTGTVQITVDITDEDSGLEADISIDGAYIITANSYSWNTLGYSDGSHTILAEVTDSGNLYGSDSITVTVNNGGGDADKYALVIGISDYEDPGNDLEYCDDDALDWKNFLQSQGYSVNMLTDNQAKAADIEAALYALLAAEDADDYVVFTYSGHGYNYPGYGSCIISQDLAYMTHGYFESFFDLADSQHIYFAFDACEIGGFSGLVDATE